MRKVLGQGVLVAVALMVAPIATGSGIAAATGTPSVASPTSPTVPKPAISSGAPASSLLAGKSLATKLRHASVSGTAVAATIAVAPNVGLIPVADVTVTGSGLPVGTTGIPPVLLVECTVGATTLGDCGFATQQGVSTDASGNLSTGFSVFRTLVTPLGTVRCDDAPESCEVVALDTATYNIVATAPVSFDPTIPRPNATIDVTPATGLLEGQVVSVHGSGWVPGNGVQILECGVGGLCSNGFSDPGITVDPDGTFTAPFTVRLRAFNADQSPTNCVAIACELRATDQINPEYTAAGAVAFDPSQPLPATPKITVTPATGLHHNQQVTVNGTGFDAGTFADLSECAPGESGFCTDTVGSVGPIDATGTFTTTVNVSRLVSTFSFTPGDLGPTVTAIDCIAGGCTIVASESVDAEFGLNASAPLAFDPADPAPAIPQVTAAPVDNLPYRAVVTVNGTGFAPGEQVFAQRCVESASTGFCSGIGAVADTSGAVSIDVPVHRLTANGFTPLDCGDPLVQCSVRLSGQHSYEQFSFPLTFDPNAPIPPSATMTVTPHDNLGYRQVVHVQGDGFAPGAPLMLLECALFSGNPENPVGFSVCGSGQIVTPDAQRHVDASFTARRVIGGPFQSPVDCGGASTPTCVVQIGELEGFGGDPSNSGSVRVTFDPNSVPPPPPTVHVAPTTHLVDGQVLAVSGSGFTANATVGIASCRQGALSLDDCDLSGARTLRADGAGAFTTTFPAAAHIQTTNAALDCTSAPGVCGLGVADLDDITSASAVTPLSFAVPKLPELDLRGVRVREGTGGVTAAPVGIVLSGPAPGPVVVHWRAVAGSATSADYTAVAGTVTIPAGAVSGTIPAEVVADALDEPTERFQIVVDSVTGATVGDGTASVTIIDDDRAPRVVVADARVGEGDGSVDVVVMLTALSGRDVRVEYRTHRGSARSGSDFVRGRGTVTIPAGQMVGVIHVGIVDDTKHERTERFTVKLDHVDGAVVGDDSATVTIMDND